MSASFLQQPNDKARAIHINNTPGGRGGGRRWTFQKILRKESHKTLKHAHTLHHKWTRLLTTIKTCLVCITEDVLFCDFVDTEQQLLSCSAFLTATRQKMKWENGGIVQRPDWEKNEAAGTDKEGRTFWTSCVFQKEAWPRLRWRGTVNVINVIKSNFVCTFWANSCFTSEASGHARVRVLSWIFQLREEIQVFLEEGCVDGPAVKFSN